jgi:hypothetical protein
MITIAKRVVVIVAVEAIQGRFGFTLFGAQTSWIFLIGKRSLMTIRE